MKGELQKLWSIHHDPQYNWSNFANFSEFLAKKWGLEGTEHPTPVTKVLIDHFFFHKEHWEKKFWK